jgi:hypothetical protein
VGRASAGARRRGGACGGAVRRRHKRPMSLEAAATGLAVRGDGACFLSSRKAA